MKTTEQKSCWEHNKVETNEDNRTEKLLEFPEPEFEICFQQLQEQ